MDKRTFTVFSDSYSGGHPKQYRKGLALVYIAIDLPINEAEEYFSARFGDPYNVTCECCGPDYSTFEEWTLEDIRQLGGKPLVILTGGNRYY